MSTFRNPAVDVHLILRRNGAVLLAQRAGSYGHGQWAMPCGKVEPAEPVPLAAVRELAEETGLIVSRDQIKLAHTVHAMSDDGLEQEHLGFFFAVHHWVGEPRLAEPSKCLEQRWWPLDALPAQLMPYSAYGLARALEDPGGMSLFGWGERTESAAAAAARDLPMLDVGH